ncbi:SAM-dependent methyltransferase [Nonomuraea fuscirosea]|uniref:SAM-dependent methyltransferase n=1 Tax=Nonomuraea fuscirosea TaxID=1291556 RepID=UPI0033CFBB44
MNDWRPSLDWQSGVEPDRPNSARMYNYYLGGKDYFPADVAAARKVQEKSPVVVAASRENRYFLGRAVRFLAGRGIRQFLDIGAGLPSAGNVHEIAPDARVVYVDNDPVVIVHARALMAGGGGGRVRVVQGDAREPDGVLEHPDVVGFLDFDEPIGLLMIGLLHFVRDEEGVDQVVPAFTRNLASNSYAVISHGTDEGFDYRMVVDVRAVYETAMSYQMRSRAHIERFFAGLDLVDPGVLSITDWHPDGVATGVPSQKIGILGGVGRIP